MISPASNTAKTSADSLRAASTPSASIRFAKIGTKAALNAPSAKSRRKRLGNLKATTKISAKGPAPKDAAISTSRRNPRIRLIKVAAPVVAAALTMENRLIKLLFALV